MAKFNRTCWTLTLNGRYLGGCQLEGKSYTFIESPPTFYSKEQALRYAETRIKMWVENGASYEDCKKRIKAVKARVNFTPI